MAVPRHGCRVAASRAVRPRAANERRRPDREGRRWRPSRFRGAVPPLRAAGPRTCRCACSATDGRAEDAAQDTFAAVWRSATSYKPERGSGSAWLFAVARHAIIDRARQRTELTVAEPIEQVSDEAGPAEVGGAVVALLHGAGGDGATSRTRAPGARARVLERLLAERGRELPRRSARHGQDADPGRASAGSPLLLEEARA